MIKKLLNLIHNLRSKRLSSQNDELPTEAQEMLERLKETPRSASLWAEADKALEKLNQLACESEILAIRERTVGDWIIAQHVLEDREFLGKPVPLEELFVRKHRKIT